tara:strand:+ start:513 stop:725 length:213 start_codon:yes stop_codon:yes gene_type:complete
MSNKINNSKLTPKQKEFVEFLQNASNQKKEKQKRTWKVWAFVIGLNIVGLLGVIYLKSNGIDVFALRGDS